MFGLSNLFKKLGGSLLQKLATKVLADVPGLNTIAGAALKLCDSLPLTKLRAFLKDRLGVDLKDLLKLTPLAPVSTVLEARDLLASSIEKHGAPVRGSHEWSAWFNAARVAAFEEYRGKLRVES